MCSFIYTFVNTISTQYIIKLDNKTHRLFNTYKIFQVFLNNIIVNYHKHILFNIKEIYFIPIASYFLTIE